MGDDLLAGKPSRYVTSHPGQLSLAIPSWGDAISTDYDYGHRWGRIPANIALGPAIRTFVVPVIKLEPGFR